MIDVGKTLMTIEAVTINGEVDYELTAMSAFTQIIENVDYPVRRESAERAAQYLLSKFTKQEPTQ